MKGASPPSRLHALTVTGALPQKVGRYGISPFFIDIVKSLSKSKKHFLGHTAGGAGTNTVPGFSTGTELIGSVYVCVYVCVFIYIKKTEKIYSKELTHVTDKSQDLQLATWRPKRDNGVVPVQV